MVYKKTEAKIKKTRESERGKEKKKIAIDVKRLVKTFDGFNAVDGISFEVKEGELFGLLGPNGAGKTTTINMLSTLIRPTSGRALVAGNDVSRDRDAVRKSIGIVFQEPALDDKLTGKENLDFHARLYGLSPEMRRRRIAETLRLVELVEWEDTLVEKYSGGMKRRLEIARGLIHKPKVLFLDEPTLGLDAQTRRRIWEYIRGLNRKERVTIVLTTHYMEEADYLCERTAIIDHGKIVALDSPDRLKDVLGGDVISIEVEKGSENKKLAQALRNAQWVKGVKTHNHKVVITVQSAEKKIPSLIKLSEAQGVKVSSVNLRKPSLEDVFLHYTGKTIRDREATQNERARDIARRRKKMRGGR